VELCILALTAISGFGQQLQTAAYPNVSRQEKGNSLESSCSSTSETPMSDKESKSTKIVAELVIAPFKMGISLSKYVRQSVKVIDQYPGIRVQHTPMSSIIEADNIDQILDVTKDAHEKMFEAGAQRVSTLLRIDDRRDKPRRMEDKTKAII
jgi:uncharacterized protein (TIGR00106 family)